MIHLEFENVEDVNVLLRGLAELPAKDSFDLIIKIQKETQKQLSSDDKEE